jgi:hypothetical protein
VELYLQSPSKPGGKRGAQLKRKHRDNIPLLTVQDFLLTNVIAYILHLIRVIKSRRMSGRDVWHAGGRGEVFTGFWF